MRKSSKLLSLAIVTLLFVQQSSANIVSLNRVVVFDQHYRKEPSSFNGENLITLDPQTQYVKNRILEYLRKIVQLSKAHQPPGANAANGWVTIGMRELMSSGCGRNAEIELSGDAIKLFDVYALFFHRNQTAWDRDNYKAEWYDTKNIYVIQFGDAVDAFFNKLFSAENQPFSAIEGVLDFVKKIVASDLVHTGAHANGWIAVGMKNCANECLTRVNAHFPGSNGSPEARIANAMSTMFKNLSMLPTEGHEPWLHGTWQASYQTILEVAINDIERIN
jgi:hypothetical protein